MQQRVRHLSRAATWLALNSLTSHLAIPFLRKGTSLTELVELRSRHVRKHDNSAVARHLLSSRDNHVCFSVFSEKSAVFLSGLLVKIMVGLQVEYFDDVQIRNSLTKYPRERSRRYIYFVSGRSYLNAP